MISRRAFTRASSIVLAGTGVGLRARSAKPLSICLISGSLEYKSDASLSEYQAFLESNGIAKCSRAFRKTDEDCPGLEALKTADLMVLFARRLKISGDSLRYVKDFVAAGKPIVGIRTASHAFQNWLEFDRDVLGGSYKSHYKSGPVAEVQIVPEAKDHPVLREVEPFRTDGKLYKNRSNAKDTTTLLTGSIPGNTEPVAWTRLHNGGRVFYTSLGHPNDFAIASFRRLLLNAIRWAANPTL